MGRILFWVAALIIGASLLTALVIWLAPLLAALVVLYVAGKIIIFRTKVGTAQNYSMQPVDSAKR